MNKALILDAIHTLQQHIDPDCAITLQNDDARLQDIIELLNGCAFARSRKVTILACCILINLAIDKHHELMHNENEKLTRNILDGDYLMGLYYRFAMEQREWKLLAHLTAFNKKVPLMLLKGSKVPALISELKTELQTYIDRQSA